MSNSVIYGANWYVDSLNTRLYLEEVRLARLRKAMERFVTGGGFFQLDVPMEVEPLEVTFSLRGAHERVRGLMGREAGDWTTFYYYERLRDIMRGVNRGRVVVIKGLIVDVEQPEVRAKKAGLTRYTVGSIVHYRDVVSGRVVHKFDYFNNTLVMNGVEYSAQHNRLIAA